MIRFSVARLEKEPIRICGEQPAAWLELDGGGGFELCAPVRYDLLAEYAGGHRALVRGEVGSAIKGECGRCLEETRREISVAVDLVFELEGCEEVDISEDIRSELLLGLPMTLLCSDDCPGLCPRCGANLRDGDCRCGQDAPEDSGADNRWSALDQLKL